MKFLFQKNFCAECGCSCKCIAICNGNTKKCTSLKAKSTKCPHCCDCFILPLSKSIHK